MEYTPEFSSFYCHFTWTWWGLAVFAKKLTQRHIVVCWLQMCVSPQMLRCCYHIEFCCFFNGFSRCVVCLLWRAPEGMKSRHHEGLRRAAVLVNSVSDHRAVRSSKWICDTVIQPYRIVIHIARDSPDATAFPFCFELCRVSKWQIRIVKFFLWRQIELFCENIEKTSVWTFSVCSWLCECCRRERINERHRVC